jgi:hypothetical protein
MSRVSQFLRSPVWSWMRFGLVGRVLIAALTMVMAFVHRAVTGTRQPAPKGICRPGSTPALMIG